MPIMIGESQVETSSPADLEAELLASTGCAVAEVHRMLLGDPLAGFVARVLAPFLPEPPVINDLALQIEAAGVKETAAQVAALLVPPAASAEAAADHQETSE